MKKPGAGQGQPVRAMPLIATIDAISFNFKPEKSG